MQNINSLYAYDLIQERWNIAETGPLKPEYRDLHSSFLHNDDLYIAYGFHFETTVPLNTIWKFNFLSSQWNLISNITDDDLLSTDMVQEGSIVYSFGGRGTFTSYNALFYFNLTETSLSKTILSTNWDSPKKRKDHCSAVVNDHILIFGGMSDSGEYLNDVWDFDISLNIWNYIVTTGSAPPVRALSGCASTGNSFLVFGGTDGTLIYNDFYHYDAIINYWKIIGESAPLKPSPRYSSCVISNINSIYILGGQDAMGIFDEIWLYDYLSITYTQINTGDKVKIVTVDYGCWLDSDPELVIYVLGGIISNYNPSTALYKINLIEANGVYSTSTSIVHNTLEPIAAEASMVRTGDLIYVVFGSYWKRLAISQIMVFNYKTYEEYYIELDYELALYGHTASHYGDSLYIIGGGSTIGGIKLGFTGNNVLYKLTRSESDPVYLACSDGTIEPECTPCPEGYVFQGSGCLPCPAGTFSTVRASTSYSMCAHCMFGTYSSKEGGTYCLDCPTGAYCPIGSSQPTERILEIGYQSIQPIAYIGRTAEISEFISYLWYSTFIVIGLTVVGAAAFPEFWKKLKIVDLLVNQHGQVLNKPVVFRKTKVGGLFSLFFVLSAGVIVIGSFLTYYLDNITEIKSLVPVLLLENDVSADTVTVLVSFYVYGGTCVQNSSCSPDTIILNPGIFYKSRDISCAKTGSTCTILINYNGFSLSAESLLQINMLDPYASATSIGINVTSTSSIPNQESSVFLPVSPGSDLLIFLGITPTVVTYEFTPSVIYIQVFKSASSEWPSLATGYHLSVSKGVSLGSTHTQQSYFL